jgi:hypothetical protein
MAADRRERGRGCRVERPTRRGRSAARSRHRLRLDPGADWHDFFRLGHEPLVTRVWMISPPSRLRPIPPAPERPDPLPDFISTLRAELPASGIDYSTDFDRVTKPTTRQTPHTQPPAGPLSITTQTPTNIGLGAVEPFNPPANRQWRLITARRRWIYSAIRAAERIVPPSRTVIHDVYKNPMFGSAVASFINLNFCDRLNVPHASRMPASADLITLYAVCVTSPPLAIPGPEFDDWPFTPIATSTVRNYITGIGRWHEAHCQTLKLSDERRDLPNRLLRVVDHLQAGVNRRPPRDRSRHRSFKISTLSSTRGRHTVGPFGRRRPARSGARCGWASPYRSTNRCSRPRSTRDATTPRCQRRKTDIRTRPSTCDGSRR